MNKTGKQTLEYCEEMGNRWLAEGNEAAERGNHKKAERCYEKGQYWLDRANKALGWDGWIRI